MGNRNGRPKKRIVIEREGRRPLILEDSTEYQQDMAEFCMEVLGRYKDLPYPLSRMQVFFLLMRNGFDKQYGTGKQIPPYILRLLPENELGEVPPNIVRTDYTSPQQYLHIIKDEYKKRAWDVQPTHVEVVAQNYSMAAMYKWLSDEYCVHVTFIHSRSVTVHIKPMLARLQESFDAKRPVKILAVSDRSFEGDRISDRIKKEVFTELGVKQREYTVERVAITREQIEDDPDKFYPVASPLVNKLTPERRRQLKSQKINDVATAWKHIDRADVRNGKGNLPQIYEWCQKNGLWFWSLSGADPYHTHKILINAVENSLDLNIVEQIKQDEMSARDNIGRILAGQTC